MPLRATGYTARFPLAQVRDRAEHAIDGLPGCIPPEGTQLSTDRGAGYTAGLRPQRITGCGNAFAIHPHLGSCRSVSADAN